MISRCRETSYNGQPWGTKHCLLERRRVRCVGVIRDNEKIKPKNVKPVKNMNLISK